ncbi:unnamed protein product, partial [Rotaria sordida]
VGAQSTGSSTNNECPVGFCPRGGTCSQLSGQWQCACGANGCVGLGVVVLVIQPAGGVGSVA